MKTDIEIASECKLEVIENVANELDINKDALENYGKYMAKVNLNSDDFSCADGNLVLVTAISPTPAGEGKSTVSVGLSDGLRKIGKKTIACLREPSLGPVFGIKGGATGGGMSQVVPMENINLHFTGDMHAITSANNLICACLDNHIHHGNELNVDIDRIVIKRSLDMNDRNLRYITNGQGSKFNGVERKDGFNITVASEVMAILCLSKDLMDFKKRVGNMTIAFSINGTPITVANLEIQDAVTLLMKDAIKPNLVQTLEHTPVLLHGGPFANIAHGCNSLIATKLGLKLADYVVTEAGFGADLGFEKFIDIKSRIGNLSPKVVVLVATIRALKMHGGLDKTELNSENIDALKNGFKNLERHCKTIKKSNINFIVAINHFACDTKLELDCLTSLCKESGFEICVSNGYLEGSNGMIDLANKVVELSNNENKLKFFYDDEDTFEVKLDKLVKNVYGGNNAILTDDAKKDLEFIKNLKLDKLPICVAKTPASFTDDPKIIGAPIDFDITVTNVKISSGAGFLVVLTGNIMTMPGLPKVPSANKMKIDKNGVIEGLF